MRDDSYLESGAAAKAAARKWRNGAVTALGALISVAILIGVVAWSYRLGMRDAEDIPVIRAELGPTKVRPEEPGGQDVAHQDRVVYDVISGEDAPAAGEAALAPAPDGLAAADKAPASLSPKPAPRPAAEGDVLADSPEPATAPRPENGDAAEAEAEDATVSESPDGENPGAEDPLAAAVAAAVAEVVAEGGSASETRTDSEEADGVIGQGPKFAPSAAPRPARTAAPAPGAANAEAAEPREAAAASEIQIQLGAFDTEEIAAREWTRIKAENGDLLTGRGRVIMSVRSGGRTLWRLRAGPFDAIADAAALCRGFQARNEACIVARAR